MDAMCTHLPAEVVPDEIDTVDLHQFKGNELADNLYNARKFYLEEREGEFQMRDGVPVMQENVGTYRKYQVDNPDWLYRRCEFQVYTYMCTSIHRNYQLCIYICIHTCIHIYISVGANFRRLPRNFASTPKSSTPRRNPRGNTSPRESTWRRARRTCGKLCAP